MELKFTIDKIDYGGIAKKAIPIVIKKLSASHADGKLAQILQKMGNAPADVAKVMLNALPQDMKDQVAVLLLQSYKEELTGLLNDFAAKKGVEITVSNIEINP